MWSLKPTLAGRVTLWLTLFSVSLFLIIGFMTFFVTLSHEDKMLHNILRNVSQNKLQFNASVEEISVDRLIDLGYPYATKKQLSELNESFGEFEIGDQYFHFMITDGKVLLMNSTQFIISEERLENILKLQLQAFFPFLLVAFLISRLIAKRALKPFSQLKEQFLTADRQAESLRAFNQSIRETDIKQIADELAMALEQKENSVEQQITFNKGISHELRTPLQIMTHAVELIALKKPELKKQDVYRRLTDSISRMHRIGEALLWLTSDTRSTVQTQVNQCLNGLKVDLENTYREHALTITTVTHNTLNLPMPEVVFDFIVFNLVNNTIEHGKKEQGKITLNIEISETAISFKNLFDESKPVSAEDHFCIGLTLIDKLCHRFGVTNSIHSINSQFIVTIDLKANGKTS